MRQSLAECVKHARCAKSAAWYKTLHSTSDNLAWNSVVKLPASGMAKAYELSNCWLLNDYKPWSCSLELIRNVYTTVRTPICASTVGTT